MSENSYSNQLGDFCRKIGDQLNGKEKGKTFSTSLVDVLREISIIFFLFIVVVAILLFIGLCNSFCGNCCECVIPLIFIIVSGVCFGVIAIVKTKSLIEKSLDQEAKIEEKLLDAAIRHLEEEEEFSRLEERMATSLVEKNTKAMIDEEAREAENRRRIALMEEERMTEIANHALDIMKDRESISFEQLKELTEIISSLTK